MSRWVKLCTLAEAPPEGSVIETAAEGIEICLARHNGELAALDNWCPHRRGPLGQGWIEGEAVICPWHSWAFNLKTGDTEPPERDQVDVFPIRLEGEDVLVDIE
jgi:nitrite reductase (NADH) small subunit